MIIYHDGGGQIRQRLSDSVMPVQEPDILPDWMGCTGVRLLDDYIEPSTQYFDIASQMISVRRPVTLTTNKQAILADGSDAATVTGLPPDGWLQVDGQAAVQASPYALKALLPGSYILRAVGKYISDPLLVTAYDLTALKIRIAARIDAAAEATRLKYITPGSGQAMVYQQKANEAKAYITATNPVDADYPLLAAEAVATGISLLALARNVAATAAEWTALAANIEALRIGGKRQAASAANITEALAAEAIAWP